MPEAKDLLIATRTFFRRNGWTQYAAARDKMGLRCAPDSVFAVSWCLLNGMHHVAKQKHMSEAIDGAADMLKYHIGVPYKETHAGYVINQWEDSFDRTFDDIMALLDKAIANAPCPTCGKAA